MAKLSGTILDDAKRRPARLGAGTGPGNSLALFAAAGLLIGALAPDAGPVYAAMRIPKPIAAAVADPARPAADRARDALRKPAACLAFAGVRPGMKVAELFPGKGYFTRLFSRVLGPTGHLYEVTPPPKESGEPVSVKAIADDPHYGHNITVLLESVKDFSVPRPVDLVWTSQNYHDLHNVPGLNVADFDRAVYKALKPGGIFLVLDHVAPSGSGFSDTDTLHRIDPEAAKKEILSAGFQFVGESSVLRNPNDPHTNKVFDPSIRGRTDQFIYKFRKPK
jgi:predicted methyltransferase